MNRDDEAYEALAQVQAIEESQRTKTLEDAGGARQLVQQAAELRAQERRGEALSVLEEAIELAPQNPLPRVLEVRLLIEMKRDREALDRSENLVRITGGAPEALHLRGMSKLGLRDIDGAEQDFRAALEKDSKNRAAMNALALTLMSKGELAEAEQILLKVVELFPDDTIAEQNLERIRDRR
jgi:Flp pilus assembly protein TadD